MTRTTLQLWCRRYVLAALVLVPLASDAETLSQAWAIALQADGGVAAARSEREAAEAEHTATLRQRWPSLDLNGNYTQFQRTPQLDITTPAGQLQAPLWRHDGYTAAGADLSVAVWTSGRTGGAIGSAAAATRGATAQEAQRVADLKLAVAEAYVEVLRTRRALAVAESNVSSLTANQEDVSIMFDKQAVPQSDLLAAKVSLANAEQRRLRAANAVNLATAAYNRWVGQPLDRWPELFEPVSPRPADARADLDQMVAHAMEQRPELAALAAQKERFEQSARSEAAQGLPQVVLHATYNHFDNQILDRENFASLGIGFQWRVFDSGQLKARVDALRSHARAAGEQLADYRSVIALQVRSAVFNREEASARISALAATVAQAEENVRDAKEIYANGLGTSNQVLDAETLRVTALGNRDSAIFDLLTAEFRLQRVLGDL